MQLVEQRRAEPPASPEPAPTHREACSEVRMTRLRLRPCCRLRCPPALLQNLCEMVYMLNGTPRCVDASVALPGGLLGPPRAQHGMRGVGCVLRVQVVHPWLSFPLQACRAHAQGQHHGPAAGCSAACLPIPLHAFLTRTPLLSAPPPRRCLPLPQARPLVCSLYTTVRCAAPLEGTTRACRVGHPGWGRWAAGPAVNNGRFNVGRARAHPVPGSHFHSPLKILLDFSAAKLASSSATASDSSTPGLLPCVQPAT